MSGAQFAVSNVHLLNMDPVLKLFSLVSFSIICVVCATILLLFEKDGGGPLIFSGFVSFILTIKTLRNK